MNFNDYCTYSDGLLYKKGSKIVYGSVTTDGYIRVSIQGKRYKAHRVIWMMLKSDIPIGYCIDHIDGNKVNNRIENLRLATFSQNSANSVGSSKTLPKGVKAQGNKFQARIGHQGKRYHLGTFSTVEDAHTAYITKAKELFGDYAHE